MSNLANDNSAPTDAFDAFFRDAEQTDQFWVSKAKLRFTEEMLNQMEAQGVTKSQLAQRLGVTPAQISRLCSGLNNFTMETMVRIARGLKCEFNSHLQPEAVTTHWIDVLKCEPVPLNFVWAEEGAEFRAITHQRFEQKVPYVIESVA